MKISPQEMENVLNLSRFAPLFLKIKSKSGALINYQFNVAQDYIHTCLERQLKKTGKVRAIIVKGRQQGCSTYIQARYFHKIITNRGKKAFILTHEAEATKNLFEMTKRYYDKLPAGLCPEADKSSAKELRFEKFDSGYAVGTAGNKGVGRSQTIQLFHGSEVAYWPNADEHAKGVLQTVSNEPGTEIILESTANGIGNYFHSMWKSASSNNSEFQPIFVPWYWQKEYTLPSTDMILTEDEQTLLDFYAHAGLTIEHLAWRRMKIKELSDEEETGKELFYPEYPMSADEAFRSPTENAFINAKYVMRARRNNIMSDSPLIIGVDPAVADRDKTAIIRRKGRKAFNLETFRNHNTMEICGRLTQIIREERPQKVYVDCIGVGAGIVDRMRELGYSMVEGVNVARSANERDRFANLRVELWWTMRDWLMQNELPVQIPDNDDLHGSLCSVNNKKARSNGQQLIEGKDDLKARGMPSPDEADALSLTFYSGVYGFDNVMPVTIVPEWEKGMFT